MKVIDEKAFMETFQYFDKSIVIEIIDIFIQEYPDRIAALKKDIEAKDFNKLKFDAHSMKGVISNFFAEAPQKYAKELELKGVKGDGEGLTELFESLQNYSNDLLEDLELMKPKFTE